MPPLRRLLAVLTATAALAAVAAAPAAAVPAARAAAVGCGVTGSAATEPSRKIDLVLDDSGSMFEHSDPYRWSDAKYALEVFAALLEHDDTLNVYRMSDFADGASAGPRLVLSGATAASSNVAQIAGMPMQGGGTPYKAVTTALSDLKSGSQDAKWLVVLTDGAFDGVSPSTVQSDLRSWVSVSPSRHVALMTIGQDAPVYSTRLGSAITTAHVSSSDVLGSMTGFANAVFGRRELTQSAPGRVDTGRIGLDEAIVFAQGAGASIGSARAGGRTFAPQAPTAVSWVENPSIEDDGRTLPATPNQNLVGRLATFSSLPGGSIDFGASAANITVFYRPTARFAVQLLDSRGHVVDASKALAGTYRVRYGLVDSQCRIVSSPLFGGVAYDATISENGRTIAAHFQPGGTVTLQRGQVDVAATARYLGTATARQNLQILIQEPARPASVTSSAPRFAASRLDGYTAPSGAIALNYETTQNGKAVPFTAQEWKTVTPQSFHVTSTKNIPFTVSLGATPGRVYLVPHAPGGDVYRADTGSIPITVTGSHVYDQQVNRLHYTTTANVVDDLSFWTRAAHWFADTGWKLALGLLALILLLGYLFKRRFSKRLKRSPRIVGMSNMIGRANEEAQGRFTVRTGRKLLPFVPDKATLRFTPPGVTGFKAMRLTAGPGKTMLLDNWRQLAEKSNVEINGMELGPDTRRAPRLSAAASITARTPAMSYEMTPTE